MYKSKYVFFTEKFIMTLIEKIVTFLRFEMPTPPSYGLFHIAFLLLTVGATVLLIRKFRDADEKTFRRLLMGAWITLVILEIYKQVVFAYREDIYVPGHMIWSYHWYGFPFQLCSSPLYLFPFAALLKESRVKDAVVAFLATFSVFGGLAVIFYPNDVFTVLGGVNVQTMIHHGSQIAVGLLLAARYRRRWNLGLFAKGIVTFAVMSGIALVLNEVMYAHFTAKGITNASFNMFYISRHYGCSLPLLSMIYPKVPYPVFLLIYLLGFAVVSGLIFLAVKVCIRLANRRKGA